MPSEEVTAPSEEGFESHTTRHFPSSTIGSVSFWPEHRTTPHPKKRASARTAQVPGQRAGTMVGSLDPGYNETTPAAPWRFIDHLVQAQSSSPPFPLPSFLSFSHCDAPLLLDTDALRLPSLLCVLVDFGRGFKRPIL